MVSRIRGGIGQRARRQELPLGIVQEGGAADGEPAAGSGAATGGENACVPPVKKTTHIIC